MTLVLLLWLYFVTWYNNGLGHKDFQVRDKTYKVVRDNIPWQILLLIRDFKDDEVRMRHNTLCKRKDLYPSYRVYLHWTRGTTPTEKEVREDIPGYEAMLQTFYNACDYHYTPPSKIAVAGAIAFAPFWRGPEVNDRIRQDWYEAQCGRVGLSYGRFFVEKWLPTMPEWYRFPDWAQPHQGVIGGLFQSYPRSRDYSPSKGVPCGVVGPSRF